MKKSLLLSTLILVGSLTTGFSQEVKQHTIEEAEATFLKGLRKPTGADDMGEKGVVLDGESVPIYTLSGKKVERKEIWKLLESGDYKTSIYIDESKEIKAVLLRPATKEERIASERRKEMEANEKKLIGTQGVPFSVTDINGNTFSLQELKGKVVVINFWFIACKPCIQEIPDLNRIVKKNKGKDVVFLGFARDDELKLKSFLTKKEFNYNIVSFTEQIRNDYMVFAYPTHIIIDQKSIIRFKTTGLSNNTTKQLEKKIDRLLK